MERLHQIPRPQLIIVDLLLPGMEGWEFRHEQKGSGLAAIPVKAMSAGGKLVDVEVSLRKPLDYDELMSAVNRFVP
jgi:CheY-like chemotaxis protein